MARSMIAIVDLGSNQNAFIARELRKLGVYSEIFNYDVSPEELKNTPGIQGIIVPHMETAEQAELRREYLAEYRENMKAMLDNLVIQEQDGTRHALKQKDNPPVQ